MFGLSDKKKKEKDTQVLIEAEIAKNRTVQQMTAQADKIYQKPEYNPQTRRTHYDSGQAHEKVKKKEFSKSNVVKDPYTGEKLVLTIEEAKKKYGGEWQNHLAEADHIDPLNQIVKRVKNSGFLRAWVKTEDVKNIGNSEDNFQVISRTTNQTGGKGGSTQEEWSRDSEKMRKLSEQSGRSEEDQTRMVRKIGEEAEKENNKKLLQAGIKNAAATAHAAGTATAINAGGTAAAISAINNVTSCINGEKTVSEALKNVGKDGSKAAISGYASGAGMTALNHTLTSSNSSFLAAIGENNVVGNVVMVVSATGETVVKWGNGEISTEECLVELGGKGSSLVGASYGAAVGQALIPIPIIGGAVGSFVGGVMTSELYNRIVQAFGYVPEEERRRQQEAYEVMMRYYAEQQRREEVQQLIKVHTEEAVLNSVWLIIQSGEFQNLMQEAGAYFKERAESEQRIAELVLVSLQMQEYRRQLQEYANNYFAGYEDCFERIFDYMDCSLKIGDYDAAITEVNQFTRMFGKNPAIENKEDFKKKLFGEGEFSF